MKYYLFWLSALFLWVTVYVLLTLTMILDDYGFTFLGSSFLVITLLVLNVNVFKKLKKRKIKFFITVLAINLAILVLLGYKPIFVIYMSVVITINAWTY